MPDFVVDFVRRMRDRASDSLLCDSVEAKQLRKFLEELEREYAAHQDEELTTRQAAEESGYTLQAIRMLRRNRVISNRRRDLPRKPGHGVEMAPRSVDSAPSIADRVLGSRRRRRAS